MLEREKSWSESEYWNEKNHVVQSEQGVRLKILKSIHVVFAGRKLVTTYVWSVLGEFPKDVVAFQES